MTTTAAAHRAGSKLYKRLLKDEYASLDLYGRPKQ
jgi:hypothetical protein